MSLKPLVFIDTKFSIRQRSNEKRLTTNQNFITKLSPKKQNMTIVPTVNKMLVLNLLKSQIKSKPSQTKPLKVLTTEIHSNKTKPICDSINQNFNSDLILKKSANDSPKTKKLQRKESDKQNHLLRMNFSQSKKKSMSLKGGKQLRDCLKISMKGTLKNKITLYQKTNNILSQGVEVAIQTETSQINQSSYQQCLNFRITKKQNYEKFQNLFDYIQNLSGLDLQNIANNMQQFRQIFKNDLNSERQKIIEDLMKNLHQTQNTFNSLLKQSFYKQGKVNKELYENQFNLQTINRKIFKQIEQSIFKLMTEKQLFNQSVTPKEIKEVFYYGFRKHDAFLQKNKNVWKQKVSQINQNYKQIQQKYATWQQKVTEQARLIKSCVLSLIQFSELSKGLLGINKQTGHNLTNYEIKRCCPFCEKKPSLREINELSVPVNVAEQSA